MKIGNWKLWTAVIPLAAGAVLFVVLGGLNAVHTKGGEATKATPTASPAAVAPQDPTHEKAALQEELKRKPGHSPILLRLAELEKSAGHNKESIEYLRQAVKLDTKSVDASLELSRALYESGDVEGALAESKRLIGDQPNQVDALYNLGAIYANQNQLTLARQYWTQAAAAAPETESGKRAKDGLAKITR